MENARLLNAIIETAIDGIITIDERGTMESLNPAALKLFGYDAEEVIGQNISMLMPQPDKGAHDGYLYRYKHTGEKHIIGKGREVRGLRKDGTTFPFRLAVSEVQYQERKIYTGFIHDLSKEKEAEEAKAEVSLSLEKEKELNQMKSRFVSMASHEFRTPLSSVQLSASLIEKYAQPFENKNIGKHVGKIKSAVGNLTNILNDFLSLERLEAGRVEASFCTFDLVKLSEEIAEEMQLMAKQDQNIIYQHTGLESMVKLDQNLLKNCMINLIGNAIKYSGEHTFIEFNTEINEGQCIVTIKDNGIGIPEADQVQLFQPFFRAHNTGNIPGTGLGLNIVLRYVRLMSGNVHFESTINKGTTFILSFNK